jgi:hypothetical protein
MLLQSLLDIRPDVARGTLHVAPILPTLFSHLSLSNIRVGDERIDLLVEPTDGSAQVEMRGPRSLQLEVLASG